MEFEYGPILWTGSKVGEADLGWGHQATTLKYFLKDKSHLTKLSFCVLQQFSDMIIKLFFTIYLIFYLSSF